ncbi:MAG: hypothetical protein AAFU79_26255, partial [Myxococcota bacterium]
GRDPRRRRGDSGFTTWSRVPYGSTAPPRPVVAANRDGVVATPASRHGPESPTGSTAPPLPVVAANRDGVVRIAEGRP